MLKKNDWYFVYDNMGNFVNSNILGFMIKVLDVKDNPNYCDIEVIEVSKDRKFHNNGIEYDVDSVALEKRGTKIKPPPKALEVLFSNSVKEKLDNVKNVDTEDEYNEE